MIAAVSLRPRKEGDGFEADVHLDPIVIEGSRGQQGNPRMPEAATQIEARWPAALDDCVQRVTTAWRRRNESGASRCLPDR